MAGEKIELRGMLNTRDLGGYRTSDNRIVKKKRVLRSGALYTATPKDLHILCEDYDLKTIVDFRTRTERLQKPDPEIPGVRYLVNEILQEAQMGITHEGERKPMELIESMIAMCREVGGAPKQYMTRLYPVLVRDENCVQGYRQFFEILLDQKEGAVLYHCSEGKDRVGTATALFLSALGVDREVSVQDYLLTNFFTEENRRAIYERIREMTVEEPELAEHFVILNSVHESYLRSVFQTIEDDHGCVERFLETQMGLDEGKLQSLRDNYLE